MERKSAGTLATYGTRSALRPTLLCSTNRLPFQRTLWLFPVACALPPRFTPDYLFQCVGTGFPPQPPIPSMHYVGPMVYENRRELKAEPNTEKTLERLFTVGHLEGRSLIYCGCSTFIKGNREFLQQLVAAVSNHPQWDLVLALGGQFNLDQLGTLPANIHAFNWVSQLQVLKHADCAINNGGINSINECIHFGVPMLVYSLNRFDQNGNAARIDYHHLGMIGDIVKDKALKYETVFKHYSRIHPTKFVLIR